jgi:ribosome-associated translation inhibitor RaiA
MRIEVVTQEHISPQARTYAEYRLFTALSQLVDTDRVRGARVLLRSARRKRGGDGVSCTLTVAFHRADVLRIRTTGGHAYAAINRAVERLRRARTPDFSAGPRMERTARHEASE